MSEKLSPNARALLRDARSWGEPTVEQHERGRDRLMAALAVGAAATGLASGGTASGQAAASLPFTKIIVMLVATVVSVGAIGALVFSFRTANMEIQAPAKLGAREAARSQRTPSPQPRPAEALAISPLAPANQTAIETDSPPPRHRSPSRRVEVAASDPEAPDEPTLVDGPTGSSPARSAAQEIASMNRAVRAFRARNWSATLAVTADYEGLPGERFDEEMAFMAASASCHLGDASLADAYLRRFVAAPRRREVVALRSTQCPAPSAQP